MKGIFRQKVSPEKALLTYILAFLLIFTAAKISTQLYCTISNVSPTIATLPITYDPPAEDNFGDFATIQQSVADMLYYAFYTVRSFLIPACLLAIAIAFVVARLPGMDQRAVSTANAVIWSCIISIVVVFALTGILDLAKSLGEKL